LNITENCLDRHLATKGGDTAIIWEPNDPAQPSTSYTYHQLYTEVNKCANALKALGVQKGDRICFYMPMIPQVAIAMLACARIGAVHSVVFAGFSAHALADRIKDSSCKLVICSDYNQRGTKNIPVKEVVDEAISMDCVSVEKVLVYNATNQKVNWS